MTYTLTPQDGCWQELSGAIPQEQVRAEFNHALKEIAKQVRLPGFRPGKAPADVVRVQYGEEIKSHTVEHLINDVLHHEFDARKLVPVANPQLTNVDWAGGPDDAFKFTVRFEIPPTFEVKGGESLTIPDYPTAIQEKEVDETLAAMRRRHGKLEAIENGAAEGGQVLVVELAGKDDKHPDHALPPKDHWVKLPDAKNPSPADNDLFGPHLIGMKVGDEKSFPVNYPESADPALAGKKFTMSAKAKKLYREELPALDDEFAKKLEFESLAALRAKVREQAEVEKKLAVEDAQRGAVLEQMRKANPVPMPEGLVQRELQNRLQNLARELVMRGLKAEDVKERWEELRGQEEASTRLAVHNTLILEQLAEQEGIYASEAAVNENIERRAKLAGKPAEAIRAELERTGEIEVVGESLRRAAALDSLLNKAKKIPPQAAK